MGLFSEALHKIGQGLLIPITIILFCLIIFTIWHIGQLVVEYFMQHRKMTEDVPVLIRKIHDADKNDIGEIVISSNLLKRHKKVLLIIYNSLDMEYNSLIALAQRLLAQEEEYYKKIVSKTDLISKIGPMAGLLGTLIPLGPGVVALGFGDTKTLSESIGIAFDTTIIGLITASVSMVISTIRKGYYNSYSISLETLMQSILAKKEQ